MDQSNKSAPDEALLQEMRLLRADILKLTQTLSQLSQRLGPLQAAESSVPRKITKSRKSTKRMLLIGLCYLFGIILALLFLLYTRKKL